MNNSHRMTSYSRLHTEQAQPFLFAQKMKNLIKRLQTKKSLTGDHLRTPKRLELEMHFSRKQKKTRLHRIWEKRKNITKDCIIQSSNSEKEGGMMWINNRTWDSAIPWKNRDSVIFGCISQSHKIDYVPALNFTCLMTRHYKNLHAILVLIA